MHGLRHRLVSGSGVAAVLLSTFAAILLLDRAVPPLRLDLTEQAIWTLTEDSRALAAQVPETIELTLYFSRSLAGAAPEHAAYARFVEDTLTLFTRASDGRLRLKVVDPEPACAAEDEALEAGLLPVPVGRRGETLLLGLVARTASGRSRTLPVLDPAEDATLEYRLARLLDELTRTAPPRVGLLAGVPLAPGFDAAGRPQRGTEVHRRLAARFDLREIDPEAEGALTDLDVLLLVHPRGLSEAARYALDQFALGGGRLLVLVDPHAERDPLAAALPFADAAAPRASGAADLLAAWGARLAPDVVLDGLHAMPVNLAPGSPPTRHPAMPALTRSAFADDDPVLARMAQINLSSPGALTPTADATTAFEPLLRSSTRSALLPPARRASLRDPGALMEEIPAEGQRHVLAARLRGPARSAFTGQPGFAPERLEGEVEILVVADTDLLADPLWTARDGAGVLRPWAGNGDFVVNAVDHLAGSRRLLGVRGQPRFARPFERIEAMEREADDRFLGRLRELEAKLAEGTVAASERRRLREELRSVQRALTADVERLTRRLELAGIFGAPLLVILLGALLAMRRRLRAA